MCYRALWCGRLKGGITGCGQRAAYGVGNNGPRNRDGVGFGEIRTVLRMQR